MAGQPLFETDFMKTRQDLSLGPEISRPKRILIVDDHPIFRQGVAQIIQHEPDMIVCAEAETCEQALAALAHEPPDLVILDIMLKGASGLELVKWIKAEYPEVPTFVLSMHDETFYAERALRAGARGYVMKEEASRQVMTAIRKVLAGELYVSPSIGFHIVQKFLDGEECSPRSPVEMLSDRELEVLELIGRGFGTRQIATKLYLSIKTIESHRAHIKNKLGFKTAPEMVRFAVEWVNQLKN